MRALLAVFSLSLLTVVGGSSTAHAQSAADDVCGRGERLLRVADYSEAADALTECARRFPADARSEKALTDAIILRLGLGHDAEATRLAGVFVRTFGAKNHARAGTIVFAIAAHHGEKAHWHEAGEILTKHQSLIDAAPIDIRLQARLVAARAQLHGPTPDRGYAELESARQMYGNGGALEDMLATAYPDEEEGQRMRRTAKSLNAIGDAVVLLAGRDREKRLASLAPPVYAGPRSMDALHRHLTTTAPEWMARRRAAIEDLERQYITVLDIRPMPPPKAVIAAASAVGKMWADYADDLARLVPLDAYPATRAAGTPATTPTRAEARAAIDEVRAPILRQQAIPAMRKCVSLSVKYQYTDEHSESCEAWLVTSDPAVHARSELTPVPKPRPGEWTRDEPRVQR